MEKVLNNLLDILRQAQVLNTAIPHFRNNLLNVFMFTHIDALDHEVMTSLCSEVANADWLHGKVLLIL